MEGRNAKYLKYPIYVLPPSGPLLNNYLRGGNTYGLTAKEAQIIYAMNRTRFDSELQNELGQGVDYVAEDYWGTGVAWGMGAGVDKEFLLDLNRKFLREDLALLFVGKRFESGMEEDHLHEADAELTDKVERAHNELGKELGWKVVDANQSIEKVSVKVWKLVLDKLEQ